MEIRGLVGNITKYSLYASAIGASVMTAVVGGIDLGKGLLPEGSWSVRQLDNAAGVIDSSADTCTAEKDPSTVGKSLLHHLRFFVAGLVRVDDACTLAKEHPRDAITPTPATTDRPAVDTKTTTSTRSRTKAPIPRTTASDLPNTQGTPKPKVTNVPHTQGTAQPKVTNLASPKPTKTSAS